MTDAETSTFQRSSEHLWQSLERVRPIIFSVHVGAQTRAAEARHLMQDWAASGGRSLRRTQPHTVKWIAPSTAWPRGCAGRLTTACRSATRPGRPEHVSGVRAPARCGRAAATGAWRRRRDHPRHQRQHAQGSSVANAASTSPRLSLRSLINESLARRRSGRHPHLRWARLGQEGQVRHHA